MLGGPICQFIEKNHKNITFNHVHSSILANHIGFRTDFWEWLSCCFCKMAGRIDRFRIFMGTTVCGWCNSWIFGWLNHSTYFAQIFGYCRRPYGSGHAKKHNPKRVKLPIDFWAQIKFIVMHDVIRSYNRGKLLAVSVAMQSEPIIISKCNLHNSNIGFTRRHIVDMRYSTVCSIMVHMHFHRHIIMIQMNADAICSYTDILVFCCCLLPTITRTLRLARAHLSQPHT